MSGEAFGLTEDRYQEPVPCYCMACGALLGVESRRGELRLAFREHVDSGGCPMGGRREEGRL